MDTPKQYYDREDFYALDIVEDVIGTNILCHDRRHYLNSHDCIYEDECCRNMDDKYLLRVDGKDYILKSYADNLISKMSEVAVQRWAFFRQRYGIELDRRTPRYVIGRPMHPVTEEKNFRQKHRKSHR
jgi:hypothetical protein